MNDHSTATTPHNPTIDWNAPSAYQRATATSVTGLGSQALVEEYTIATPENVAFRYEIAGIGSRSIGAIVDTAIIGLLLLALLFAIVLGSEYVPDWFGLPEVEWVENLFIALYFLLDFAIFWGYYLLFELLWNGQTPGKRIARTRVVRSDGMPAGFAESAVRNLVRIVDFLPSAYAVGLITMLFNSSTRRLGDFAAGTYVIHDQGEVTLASLLGQEEPKRRGRRSRGATPSIYQSPPAAPIVLAPTANAPQKSPAPSRSAQNPSSASTLLFAEGPFGAKLTALNADDIELIRDALKREWQGQLDLPTLQRVAHAIATKSGALPPDADRSSIRRFLTKIADAWELAHG